MKRYLAASSLREVTESLGAGIDGVCFGAEFCAWRLPPLPEARKAAAFCAGNGLEFVAVTPIAVEMQFDRVCRWLSEVAESGCEWVANDLGVLKWASERAVGGKVTAGRMLNRQQRDPRLKWMMEGSDEAGAAQLKGSLWDDPVTVGLLMEMGVTRFALDAVGWGIGRPELPTGASLVVHAPYSVVTWSPWCHFRRGDDGPCGRGCDSAQTLRLENEEEGTPLWTRGNALFTRLEEPAAMRAAEEARAERLVWSLGIPV